MKKYFTPLAVSLLAVATLFLIAGKITTPVTGERFEKDEKRQELLYENGGFDDEEGADAYYAMRLRNPQTGVIPQDIRKKELAFAATLPKYNTQRSLQWQNRGPYNLGGRTRALALDVTDENIVLAGQVSGGMWRSTDGGDQFTQCTDRKSTRLNYSH